MSSPADSSLPKVEYRQLGKSGLRVSVPILGCMSFGSPEWDSWVLDEAKSFEILKAAWDNGINTFDTANAYSNGESERLLARFIKKFSIPRERVVIATKCNSIVGHETKLKTHFMKYLADERDYVNQSGLSRTAIFNAVHASLERLDSSYIDLLQIHRFDPKVPPEETMKALHDLVESGKVRYIGASSMRCWQFTLLNEVADKHGWTKFISMQDEYSLLYREEEREMLQYCKYNGIGVIPWYPLSGGLLARPLSITKSDSDSVRTERTKAYKGTPFEQRLSQHDEETINRVEEVAKKRGVSMARVALAWVTDGGYVTSPIVGANSIARLEDIVKIGDVGEGRLLLTKEERQFLEEPYEPKRVRGHP